MRKVALLLGMGALSGCAAAQTVYLRTDGQDMASNPAFNRQFEIDRLTCQSEPGDDRDCMAVKGYVAVAKDQAAAKQRQLAAIAAQNAPQETATGLVFPGSTPSHKTVADKKQKSKPDAITPAPSAN